jgi:uncharacterized membrane protein YjjB (DUF3815 family)
MNNSAVIRSFETGRGRRLAILLLATIIVALVIGAVVVGFRGRHISRNAAALTAPIAAPAHQQTPPFPAR